jgi:hypothetical protein
MKSIITFLYLLAATAVRSCSAFQVTQNNQVTTFLQMGLFDFKPIHGSGSGASDSELDEQWKIQQQKLAERRDHLDHAHLKAKYKGGEGVFDVHSKPSVESHMDDMYIEGQTEFAVQKKSQKKKGSAFKFPWQNHRP